MKDKYGTQEINRLTPFRVAYEQDLPLPENYAPFYLNEAKEDGGSLSYVRCWQPLGPDERHGQILSYSRVQSLKGIAPDGPLRVATTLKFKTKISNVLPDMSGCLYVSDRVLGIMKNHDLSNVEIYPVEVELYKKTEIPPVEPGKKAYNLVGGGTVIPGYWMLNFLSMEDIIDFEASNIRYKIFSTGELHISEYNRLILKARPGPFAAYKVRGFSRIFFSSALRDDLEAAGFPYVWQRKYSLAGWSIYTGLQEAVVAIDELQM